MVKTGTVKTLHRTFVQCLIFLLYAMIYTFIFSIVSVKIISLLLIFNSRNHNDSLQTFKTYNINMLEGVFRSNNTPLWLRRLASSCVWAIPYPPFILWDWYICSNLKLFKISLCRPVSNNSAHERLCLVPCYFIAASETIHCNTTLVTCTSIYKQCKRYLQTCLGTNIFTYLCYCCLLYTSRCV